MKNSKNQGSALIVLIIILSVAILGVLGYVVWNNFFAPKNINTEQVTGQKSNESGEEVSTIPDLITYDPAIVIKGSSDTAQLTNAPESFKSYVVSDINEANKEIKAQSSDCYRVITVKTIYLQRFVNGGVSTQGSCAGGAAALWALRDGMWILVDVTQSIGFECEKLEAYKVPSKIAGDTCFSMDPAYPDGKPYSQV